MSVLGHYFPKILPPLNGLGSLLYTCPPHSAAPPTSKMTPASIAGHAMERDTELSHWAYFLSGEFLLPVFHGCE